MVSVFSSKVILNQDGGRFRKRDKALFYGRKMMRKVKNISGQVRNSGQGKKRKMVMKFARRLLAMKKDEQEQLKVSEWHSILSLSWQRFPGLSTLCARFNRLEHMSRAITISGQFISIFILLSNKTYARLSVLETSHSINHV